MKFLIPYITFAGLIVTSCATSESFVNDDVYMVRPSELPIGESTADEVSYASFKSRKQGNVNDRMTYSDEMALRNRQNCLDQFRWYEGCGCSYNEWSRYSRHSSYNSMMYWGNPGFSIYYGYGNPYAGHWGMYPYNHPYHWNNPYWYGSGMGFGMGYYPHNYYGYGHGGYGYYGYGFGGHYPYGYYGYGYGGYGYGGNLNGWSNVGNNNSGTTSNVIRRPRGTSTGYSNPTGRNATPGTVKSGRGTTTPADNGKGAPVSVGRNTVVKEVGSREVISRGNAVAPSRTTTNNTGRVAVPSGNGIQRDVSPAGSRGTITPQRGTTPGTSDYQRSYPSRTNSPANTRNNSSINRSNNNQSSGGFERSSSPSRSTISSPSNSSPGTGSSGGGGGRSGSSGSSGSGGRR